MKTGIAVIVLCAVVPLAACSSGGSQPKAAPVTIAPPPVGSTATFSRTVNGAADGTRVLKIASVADVGGNRVLTELDTVNGTTAVGHTTVYADGSVTLDETDAPNSDGSSTTYTKPVLLPTPAVLASEKQVSQADTVVISKGSVHQSFPVTIYLQGNGAQSVTVPAGHYTAQEIDITVSFTVDGHFATDSVQDFRVSGVGTVEEIENDDVAVTDASTTTTQQELIVDKLTSFTAGTKLS